MDDCTSAIKLKEDYGKAYSRRAQAYSELEEFAEAVRDLEKLKELEPENEGVWVSAFCSCGISATHSYLTFLLSLLATDVRPKLRQAKLDLKKSLRKDYYKCVYSFALRVVLPFFHFYFVYCGHHVTGCSELKKMPTRAKSRRAIAPWHSSGTQVLFLR